jgi:phenylacetate-CoA ligase
MNSNHHSQASEPPPAIAWPRTPAARNATLQTLHDYLSNSQWHAAAAIASRQRQQLQTLLAFAATHSPYYRDILGRPAKEKTQYLLNELPLLTRPTLQSDYQRICTSSRPAQHGPFMELQTSGSTGQPVKVRRTGLCQIYWMALSQRDDIWHRRDATGSLAAIRTHVGTADERAPLHHDNGKTNQLRHSLPITTDIEQQAIWLTQIDPEYLLTYPTNLAALLRHAQSGKLRLPRLREVRTIAETLPDGLREACQSLLGARLTDLYSSQEFGIIALQCPDSGLYHIQSESLIVEILDENGQPCRPGEIGRLVATDLHNYATPLIRYEIGDYAEVGPPCPCGRGLPTLRRILGRERNMVRFPDGRRHWPVFGIHRFREALPGLKQFQIIQRTPHRIDVRLVVDEKPAPERELALACVIRDALNHPFELDFTYQSTEISRTLGGKFQEFICTMAD